MSATWRTVVSALPPAVTGPGDLAPLCPVAEVIELRLDALLPASPEHSVQAWVRACDRPVLATVRSRAQGGEFDGPPQAAAALLVEAAQAGARWIDVEEAVAPWIASLPASCELLYASHGALHTHAPAPSGALEKWAGPVNDAASLKALKTCVATRGPRTSVVPFGPFAGLRAALAPATHGEGFLFGAATASSPASVGQPPLAALLDELRAGEVGPSCECFGLVGRPPAWSPSPALHNAVFRAQGRAALYLPLPELDLAKALNLGLSGLSVTTPYKAAALALATEVDPVARAVGAANTMVATANGWRALNTDLQALVRALPMARDGDCAYVHGAGGYARAALFVLRERGYRVRVGARNRLAARDLAETLGAQAEGPVYRREAKDAVFVNATPAGATASTLAFLGPNSLEGLCVVDAPYAAAGHETALVSAARLQGAAQIVDGKQLLLGQALAQAQAFGALAAEAEIKSWMRRALNPPRTLALMGLRGAGKSTIGRRIALRTGRPFVDLDQDIRRATGRTPAQWIEQEGWDAFRAAEAGALARALCREGIVLALGGGATELAVSQQRLRAGAWCLWLQIDPELAAQRVQAHNQERPLWSAASTPIEEARMLLERRQPTWQALADHVIDASGDSEGVAQAAADLWPRSAADLSREGTGRAP